MRFPDWPARLEAFLNSRRDRPFGYDGNDCVMFCAAAIEAVTGVNPCQWSYGSRKEAMRLIQEHGGLVAMVDAVLPRREGPLSRGDIGLIEIDGHEFLAVMWGQYAITPGAERALMLTQIPRIGWAV